jgi:hypothetical protein
MDVNKSQTRLITGSSDNKLRVWSLDPEEFESIKQATGKSDDATENKDESETEPQVRYMIIVNQK